LRSITVEVDRAMVVVTLNSCLMRTSYRQDTFKTVNTYALSKVNL